MTYLKDIAVCIVVAMFLIFVAEITSSSFLEAFLASFQEVLFAVFAINIASAALIAQLLNTVSEKTGYEFKRSRTVVIFELKLQAWMLALSIFLLITVRANIAADSQMFCLMERITYFSKVGLMAIHLYFIWLTYELGKTLFEVLKARFPEGSD